MKVTPVGLKGLKLIELKIFRDSRGYFVERFNRVKFEEHGLPTSWAQDNHSRSEARVIRGLHCQPEPTQGKLVGVMSGAIWDVAVDVRPDSPTYGKHYALELNDENGLMLWIPPGFAHGFCVLGSKPADVLYKVDAAYSPSGERGILWNDPELSIPWPVKNPILSARDQELPSFADYRKNPVQWKT